MTTPYEPFTDEELSAALDGELPPARAEALATAMTQDAALAARYAALSAANLAAVAALSAPVSANAGRWETLLAAAPPAPARAANDNAAPATHRRRWIALAATVVIGIGLGLTLMRPAPTPLALGPSLQAALHEAPSGVETATDAGAMTIRLSFEAADGRLCRQARLPDSDLLACADARGTWQLVARVPAPPLAGTLQMASGDTTPAMLAVLDATGIARPFDAADETAAMRAQWIAKR